MKTLLKFLAVIILMSGACLLNGCSALDLVKAVTPSSESKPLLNVDTQVGDKTVAVGQTQQIKSNSGTAIGRDSFSGKSVTVHQGGSFLEMAWWVFWSFLAGFLIGWPLPATPQSLLVNWIESRKKGGVK